MTSPLLHNLARRLLLAVSMFWTVLWALVLGFTRAAVVRVLLSRTRRSGGFGAQGRGQIVGVGLCRGQKRGFLLTPTGKD